MHNKIGRREFDWSRLIIISVFVAVFLLRPALVEASSWPRPPWGTGESNPEDIRIVLITFGPGDDIASWFGHSAVLVEDTSRRVQRVYNYGMFSFGPDLLPQFLMGRLEFWVGESSLAGTLRSYSVMNRDIRLQELNLTPVKRERLARALADNVLPENRYYLYHHYEDNCATRIRDIVDEVLDGQLREFADRPGRMTLRNHTRRHSQHNPFIDFVLMLWMNDEIDGQVSVWEEMFLPEEMERVFGELSYMDGNGVTRPLVSRSEVHNKSVGRSQVPEGPARSCPLALLLGLGLGAGACALAYWHGKTGRRLPRVLLGMENVLVGLLVGLPATLLFFMWLITEHTVTYRNENLLLASPLTLMALPLGIALMAGARWAARWLWTIWLLLAVMGSFAVVLKVLPWFGQNNWMIIALVLPMNLGFALAWRWIPGLRPAGSSYFSFKTKEPSQSSEGGSVTRSRQRSRRSSAGR